MTVFSALRSIGAAMVFAAAGSGTLAQPANNFCANAQAVTVSGLNVAVSVNGTTLNATSDLAQTCGLSDELDVWYTFTAPATGMWTFDTLNSVLFDTSLAIYSSCGGTLLACNDDIDAANGYFWSAIRISLTQNQTIKIRVAGNNSDADVFRLNVVGEASNSNDACANAQTVLANQPRSGTTLAATTEFTLPAASCGSFAGSRGGRDVFYAFTPSTTGPYKVSLCTSGFDTTLAVLTGCSGAPASVVACNDDSGNCSPANRSEVPAVSLTAGVRYIIRVAGFDYEPADYGTYTLLITPLTIGVCCRGATCSFLNVADCTLTPGNGAGLAFGNSPSCNVPGNARFPCCYADYNKVNGINVQDIFDYLSDWFAGNPLAAFGGPGNTAPTVQHIFDLINAWFTGGC